ncbi:MAG TPA: DUF4439 domain-containing protein [Propionibacteriaceae bacterium]|nr:DUF4439 domain-containing protein [Propionibacteriaceae bacterium]
MPAPSTISRRRLLGLGAGCAFLAGCTLSDPTIEGPERTPPTATSPTPRPSPTPSPTVVGARRAATTELALADLARAILTGPRRGGLSADQRTLLTFLVGAHQAHATAFDPNAPARRPPTIDQLSIGQSLTQLARTETSAAKSHRAAALAVSGRDAARFGAAAIAADLYAGVIKRGHPVPVAGRTAASDLPLGTDVEAVQSLVAQLHAVVYGYQLAIGQLKVVSDRHDQAVAELLQLRIRRERFITWLTRRSADVPEPEPAYRPTVEPRDPATSAKLIRTMLVALQPFCAIWLAAAGDADRESAFDTLGTMAGLARAWNAPLPIWPGGYD